MIADIVLVVIASTYQELMIKVHLRISGANESIACSWLSL
jgi:hypothetical protein